MPEHEVTIGEVYRLFQQIDRRLETISKDMVHRGEYDADKRGIDQRFQESSRVHTELEARVAKVDTKVDSEVAAIERRLDESAKEQRQARSKWTLAIAMAVVSPILTIVVSILIRGGA